MSQYLQSRRSFLKLLGVSGGGLVIGVPLTSCAKSDVPAAADGVFQASAWLQITPTNEIHFYQPYNEMGQGTTTGVTTLLAEELEVPPEVIVVHHAPVAKAFRNPDFKIQATGGSTSIKVAYQPVRQLGADARETLRAAAAVQLAAPAAEIELRDGRVHWQGNSHVYGDFAELASTLKPASDSALKPVADFKAIGVPRPRLDGLAKATGTAVFGIDIDIPGLHYAVLVRCPVHGGSVKTVDSVATLAMPGVKQVLTIFNGVAVVAETYWQARQAAAALKLDWELPPQLAQFSSDGAYNSFKTALEAGNSETAHETGAGAGALGKASRIIEADYWAPYLAHATMEPLNCTVRIEDGLCDVWVGIQTVQVAQGLAALYGGVDRDKVTIHSTFLGGGFGRRLAADNVAEAAAIARLAGLPVQLVWSREDDIQNDVYRPASFARYKAGLDQHGELVTMTATRVGPNLMPGLIDESVGALMPDFVPRAIGDWLSKRGYGVFDGMVVDPSSVEGLVADYDIANTEVRHITLDPGLPIGFWRSVGHSFSGFFKESFIDEIAHAGGVDPMQWRLDHTRGNPRMHKVLSMVSTAAPWGQVAAGRYQGVACHSSFEAVVAQIAEVSIEADRITIHRVVCAIDCGLAVNPDIVRAQVQSAINFGITAALYGEITLKDGVVQQSNFHDYPVLRMVDAPQIEVLIVDTDNPPTGVGEPGLPPIAAAIGNAVFAASGQRLRQLPLKLS